MACPRDHSWVAFIAHLLGVELSAVVTDKLAPGGVLVNQLALKTRMDACVEP